MEQAVADEGMRQRALDRYRVVDTLPEDAYDDIVRVAAMVCDAPIALVSLIDRDRQWFKARVGLGVHETPRDEAVCDHAIRQPGVLLEVPDLARDPRFAHLPAVLGDDGLRFYAGMPLVTPGGAAIGTVCIIDRRPRVLSDDQRAGLASLARLTVNLLEGRQRERTLEQARLLGDGPRSDLYSVALVQVQRYDRLVIDCGQREADRLLQGLDAALATALAPNPADAARRTRRQPESVALLHGDAGPAVSRLRAAVAAFARDTGLQVLVGVAASRDAQERPEEVFLRADAMLSAEKDRLARH